MSFVVNSTRETPATRNVVESVIIGVVLTALSYLVGYWADWSLTQGWQLWLEVFAVFTSYSCTYLCVRERRIQYPIGAISTLAYAWLFYEFGLNASAILNLWLTAQLLYGWFRWRNDADARPVTFVALKWWPAYVVATGAFFAVGYWLDTLAGGTLVWTDVLILTLSILAQWLLDNKKWETWIVWLAVNGFAIYTYFHSQLYLVGFQYVFFALNTAYGAFVWWRSMQDAKNATIVVHNSAFDPKFLKKNDPVIGYTAVTNSAVAAPRPRPVRPKPSYEPSTTAPPPVDTSVTDAVILTTYVNSVIDTTPTYDSGSSSACYDSGSSSVSDGGASFSGSDC